DVQENQARRLLNDIAGYRMHLEGTAGAPVPEPVAGARRLNRVCGPATGATPPGLRGKREPAELFHEVLDHRWYLSERAGADVGTDRAVASYVADVLPAAA